MCLSMYLFANLCVNIHKNVEATCISICISHYFVFMIL